MSNANEDARQHDAEEEDSQTSDVPWLDNGPGHLAQATIRVPRTTKSDYNNLEWHCHPDTAPRVVTAARLVAPWTDVKLGHGHGRPGWKDPGWDKRARGTVSPPRANSQLEVELEGWSRHPRNRAFR